MNDTTTILAELKSDSAKRRERVISEMTLEEPQDPQIIAALQQVHYSDPVDYVRDAARKQLIAGGHSPSTNPETTQVKPNENRNLVIFLLGCAAVVVICFLIAIATIGILAILGPQIGNVFSRVTNGLANP